MTISYYGHSYLLIEGKGYKIALDPYGDIGLKIKKVKADYLFCSHEHYDHNNRDVVSNAKEIKGSEGCFTVINSYHDDKRGALRGENKILLFSLDGVKIAFMGDYGEMENEAIVESLKGVDILFIPIGGTYTIDSKTAIEYALKIRPKTIVPIHFKIENSTVDIDDESKFLSYFNGYKKVASPYKYNNDEGVLFISPEMEA